MSKISEHLSTGRMWLHDNRAVASTYHKCMKIPFQGSIITVRAEENPGATRFVWAEYKFAEHVPIMTTEEPRTTQVPLIELPTSNKRKIEECEKLFPPPKKAAFSARKLMIKELLLTS